jgi:hypothetical protein
VFSSDDASEVESPEETDSLRISTRIVLDLTFRSRDHLHTIFLPSACNMPGIGGQLVVLERVKSR